MLHQECLATNRIVLAEAGCLVADVERGTILERPLKASAEVASGNAQAHAICERLEPRPTDRNDSSARNVEVEFRLRNSFLSLPCSRE